MRFSASFERAVLHVPWGVRSTNICRLLTGAGSVPSSGRPSWATTAFTSENDGPLPDADQPVGLGRGGLHRAHRAVLMTALLALADRPARVGCRILQRVAIQ